MAPPKKKGVSAFIKMIKAIENGESIAITPDGPKGPKEIVKDGIIKLAQTTGAPIVPLFWKVKNHKLLNSWDNFIIPFPFSKGVLIKMRFLYFLLIFPLGCLYMSATNGKSRRSLTMHRRIVGLTFPREV